MEDALYHSTNSFFKMPYGRRCSYTVEFKVMVVDWLRKNDHNLSKTARNLKLIENVFGNGTRCTKTSKSNCVGSKVKRRKIGGGRRPLSTDLELNLFQYLEEERAQGRVVTNLDLSRKAIRIAERLALQNFKASPGWLLNWKRRHSVGIRCGTNSSQKVPADFAEQLSGKVKKSQGHPTIPNNK